MTKRTQLLLASLYLVHHYQPRFPLRSHAHLNISTYSPLIYHVQRAIRRLQPSNRQQLPIELGVTVKQIGARRAASAVTARSCGAW